MGGIDGTQTAMRSEGAFEVLVMALYPKRFRERYAHEMRLVFRQLCRDAYQRKGMPGLACVWISELPTLLVGAMCERNTTVARTVAAAGRVSAFKAITAANAIALILFGCALFFAPTNLLLAFGFVEPTDVPVPGAPHEAWSVLLPVKMMTQTLGVALVGVGGLLFAATSRLRTGLETAPGTGLPGALAGAHALLALAFAVNLAVYSSILGWVTVSLVSAFAVTYTAFCFAETIRPSQFNYGQSRAGAAGREAARP